MIVAEATPIDPTADPNAEQPCANCGQLIYSYLDTAGAVTVRRWRHVEDHAVIPGGPVRPTPVMCSQRLATLVAEGRAEHDARRADDAAERIRYERDTYEAYVPALMMHPDWSIERPTYDGPGAA